VNAKRKQKQKKSFLGLIALAIATILGVIWGFLKFIPRLLLYLLVLIVAVAYNNMVVLGLLVFLIVVYELWRRGVV